MARPSQPQLTDFGNVQAVSQALVTDLCQRVASGRRAAQRLEQITRQQDLGETDFRLLWTLREHHSGADQGPAAAARPSLDQSAMAGLLFVSAAQVSGAVARLQRQGLIQGRRPAENRRRQVWWLTDLGRVVLEEVLTDFQHVATPHLKRPAGGSDAA